MSAETWYQNPETAVEFVFDSPLPPGVPYQIDAGRLVEITDPHGPRTSSLPGREADPAGGEDPDDDPGLYPCLDCGDTAVKDAEGFYTDHCAKHTPKPTAGRGTKKA